jgi:hypothetical protein
VFYGRLIDKTAFIYGKLRKAERVRSALKEI